MEKVTIIIMRLMLPSLPMAMRVLLLVLSCFFLFSFLSLFKRLTFVSGGSLIVARARCCCCCCLFVSFGVYARCSYKVNCGIRWHQRVALLAKVILLLLLLLHSPFHCWSSFQKADQNERSNQRLVLVCVRIFGGLESELLCPRQSFLPRWGLFDGEI